MNNLKSNLVILLSFVLISCARVKITDQEYCADAGPLGATCFTTLSNQSRDLTPTEWEGERFGMICSKSESYAENVANILKACRLCKCCSYDAKQKIIQFKMNVQNFQDTLINHY